MATIKKSKRPTTSMKETGALVVQEKGGGETFDERHNTGLGRREKDCVSRGTVEEDFKNFSPGA